MLATGGPGACREVFDELRGETGAMISGRRLYDITYGWSGSHPFAGIPVFVVTHAAPAAVPDGATPFTFVTEGIANAVARAQLAAGGKSVYVIGGASIDQQLLAAGLVDELRIDVIPIMDLARARRWPCGSCSSTRCIGEAGLEVERAPAPSS